ncbi:MAG: 4Fe-4S dicluster domain-containing protein [Candidatus Bathyarchaeia archaeon]
MIQVDIERCVGCRTCEVACSLKKTGRVYPSRARIKVIRFEKRGEFHNYVPMVCQQCSTPLCMDACPLNAIYRDQNTGAVVVNEDACVGCRVCTVACPIGGISLDPVKNVAVKCDLCEGDPECVKYCEPQALVYVPKDKLDLKMKKAKSKRFSELFLLKL